MTGVGLRQGYRQLEGWQLPQIHCYLLQCVRSEDLVLKVRHDGEVHHEGYIRKIVLG